MLSMLYINVLLWHVEATTVSQDSPVRSTVQTQNKKTILRRRAYNLSENRDIQNQSP